MNNFSHELKDYHGLSFFNLCNFLQNEGLKPVRIKE